MDILAMTSNTKHEIIIWYVIVVMLFLQSVKKVFWVGKVESTQGQGCLQSERNGLLPTEIRNKSISSERGAGSQVPGSLHRQAAIAWPHPQTDGTLTANNFNTRMALRSLENVMLYYTRLRFISKYLTLQIRLLWKFLRKYSLKYWYVKLCITFMFSNSILNKHVTMFTAFRSIFYRI